MIQIGQLITDSIDEAKKERIWVGGKTSTYGSYGTYLRTNNAKGPEFFFGENYELWKKTGRSPLWAIFSGSEYGQAYKVKPKLDMWNKNEDMLIKKHGDGIAIAIDILPNADKDEVLEDIVRQLNQLADILIGVERID